MSKERILVAEDEVGLASDIINTLNCLGYIIVGQADRGEIALKKAEELKPDLVLMEIHLKGRVKGAEAAKQIIDSLKIPVVLLSAQSDTMTLEAAMTAQAYGYILKPFDEREFKIQYFLRAL